MKRVLAAAAAVAMAFAVVPAASAAADTELTGIRTGAHAGFDRIVFDLTGPRPAVSEFRTAEPENCGSGKPVSAAGEEFLEVHLRPANAHGYTGSRNFTTPGLARVRSVAFTCDFEADLGIAIGYQKPGAAYKIMHLDNPARVVIDISTN